MDYLGFNFVPTSKRYIDSEKAQLILQDMHSKYASVIPVALFQNHTFWDIQKITQLTGITTIQLHGDETPDFVRELVATWHTCVKALPYTQRHNRELYKDCVSLFIFDAPIAWLWLWYDYNILNDVPVECRFLVAWGVTIDNAKNICETVPHAVGIDVASWVAKDRNIDPYKVEELYKMIR